jgi:RNA polymerase sigma-70 factor (ECF subfamily)
MLSTSLSLVAGLRAQDGDAWRAFVKLYAPLVVRWCRKQGLNDADAADVAQEVFRRVTRDLPRFRNEAASDTFRGWLYRIAQHQIADYFRRRDRVQPAEGGSDALSWLHRQPERPDAEPDEQEACHEEQFLLQQAVHTIRNGFSDRHWQIFWRVAVDGNPADAVAAEFEATPAAVGQVKSRVLRRLREAVGEVPI